MLPCLVYSEALSGQVIQRKSTQPVHPPCIKMQASSEFTFEYTPSRCRSESGLSGKMRSPGKPHRAVLDGLPRRGSPSGTFGPC